LNWEGVRERGDRKKRLGKKKIRFWWVNTQKGRGLRTFPYHNKDRRDDVDCLKRGISFLSKGGVKRESNVARGKGSVAGVQES